jgi:hypothetical protein
VGRSALEVADIFHTFGPAWREAQAGHLSLSQIKVMSAIEQCRSAALRFRWKDYHATGRTRQKTMTLSPAEFMGRFLLHVLPSGFYRIRHYGPLANAGRRENLVRVRKLLAANSTRDPVKPAEDAAAIGSIWPTFV